MKRTFWLKRETDGARLVETKAGLEIWIPRSVCPRTLKWPPNAEGNRPVELEIEDWWWEKNGMEAKVLAGPANAQGQGKLF